MWLDFDHWQVRVKGKQPIFALRVLDGTPHMSRKPAELLAETGPFKETNITFRAEPENVLLSYKEIRNRDSSVGIAAGYVKDGRGSVLSLYSTASRPAQMPTRLRTPCVSRAHSLRVKLPVIEYDHSLPSNSEFKSGGTTV
jgi:hypothetical protein